VFYYIATVWLTEDRIVRYLEWRLETVAGGYLCRLIMDVYRTHLAELVIHTAGEHDMEFL
jgi:hypothetical protein